MIDLNKPSFLEEHIASAIGSVIGAVQSERAAHNYREAQYKAQKNRQDYELRVLRGYTNGS